MSVSLKEFSLEVAQANKGSVLMPLTAISVDLFLGCFKSLYNLFQTSVLYLLHNLNHQQCFLVFQRFVLCDVLDAGIIQRLKGPKFELYTRS